MVQLLKAVLSKYAKQNLVKRALAMVAAVEAVVVLLAVTSVVAEAAAVETVGNRINYLIEKGNQWFPFSVEGTEVAKRVEGVEVACGLLKWFKDFNFNPFNLFNPFNPFNLRP